MRNVASRSGELVLEREYFERLGTGPLINNAYINIGEG